MAAHELRKDRASIRTRGGRETSALAIEDELLASPVAACGESHYEIGLPLLGNAAPSPRHFPATANENVHFQGALHQSRLDGSASLLRTDGIQMMSGDLLGLHVFRKGRDRNDYCGQKKCECQSHDSNHIGSPCHRAEFNAILCGQKCTPA